MYVWVLRSDQTNQLEELQAEGYVEVHQDPAKADEKGVDIEGAAPRHDLPSGGEFPGRSSESNEHDDLAKLRMEGIYIIGPEINIDQAANKAWVNGAGAMTMESKTNFQGDPLTKPVPMTIYWKKEMFFTGKHAEFTEAVQADEDNARLACQNLRVSFDRPISLKEGNRGGPPPRVKKLVCSDNVRVEDRTLEGDRVVRYQRLAATSLEMNPLEPEDDRSKADAGSDGNEIRMPGPGELRLFQSAAARIRWPRPPDPTQGDGREARSPPSPASPNEPMKLTYISLRRQHRRRQHVRQQQDQLGHVPGKRPRAEHAVRQSEHRNRPRRDPRSPAGGGDVPARPTGWTCTTTATRRSRSRR